MQHFNIEVETAIEFNPNTFQQMAGLIFYYNTSHWIYFNISGDENGVDRHLQIILCDHFKIQEIFIESNRIPVGETVRLKAHLNYGRLQFYYAIDYGFIHSLQQCYRRHIFIG